MRVFVLVPALALLGACAATPQPATQRPQAIPALRPAATLTGLDRVMGKDARTLAALFGAASQDVYEGSARRLQFANGACILDAYLYPPAKGKEPVVTHIDARTSEGRPAERASCVGALAKAR